MRVLLTGSTSQQSGPTAHRRSANFMGLAWDALRSEDGRNDVFWHEPSVAWTESDLAGYDQVLVGIAPLMAMGANRVYGALSVVERLWGSGKLALVMDGPDPDLFTRNLRSVLGNWDAFTKPFFSYRKEYDLARDPETNGRLRGVAEALLGSTWPRTVVPGLPWTDIDRIASKLPGGAADRVAAVSMDGVLLRRYGGGQPRSLRLGEWAHERGSDRRWLPSLGLGLPVRDLPVNHRLAVENAAVDQLRESVGLLSGPVRGDTWWSPRVATALAVGTPVFTDWTRSQRLGPEWSALPAPHELAGPREAAAVARDQLASFSEATEEPAEALKALLRPRSRNRDRKRVAS